jgi:restriction endonuclease S subunit
VVKLGDVLRKTNNNIDPQKHNGKINYIGLENIESDTGVLIGNYEVEFQTIKSAKTKFSKNQILYGKLRPNLNKVYLAKIDGICSTDIYVFEEQDENINTVFYSYILSSSDFNKKVLQGLGGAQLPRVSWDFMSNLEVPLPPLEIQNAIVEQIEQERTAVESCKTLIALFETKIKNKIAQVWGEVE